MAARAVGGRVREDGPDLGGDAGDTAAAQIGEDVANGGKPGRDALEECFRERKVRWVTYADWQAIDKAEVANAATGAPRRKFVTISEMLSVLH